MRWKAYTLGSTISHIKNDENTFLYLLISYVAITSILSHLVDMPEILRSFISLPSMIIIPYVSGFPFLVLFSLKKHVFGGDVISWAFLSWLVGIFIQTLLAELLQFLSIFSMYYLLGATSFFFVSAVYLNKKGTMINTKSLIRKMNWRKGLLCTFVLLAGVIPVAIASIHIPYPLFGLNHDLPRSIFQPVLRAGHDNYFMLSARAPEVLLVVFSSFLYNADPLGVLWSSRFLLNSLFSLGVFLFVFRITKSKYYALLASVLAPLTMVGVLDPTWCAFFDVPAQHFRSNTILYAIFPYALCVVETSLKKATMILKDMIKLMFSTFSLFLLVFVYFIVPEDILFGLPTFFKLLRVDPLILPMFLLIGIVTYYYSLKFKTSDASLSLGLIWIILSFSIIHREESLFFVTVVFLYMFLRYSIPWIKKLRIKISFRTHTVKKIRGLSLLKLAMVLVSISTLVLYFLGPAIKMNIVFWRYQITSAEWFQVKCTDFLYGNGYLILVLSTLGVIGIVIKSKSHKNLFLSFMFILLLFSYFLPLIWTYRLFKQIPIFMAYVVTASIFSIHKFVSSKITYRKNLVNFFILIFIGILLTDSINPIWHRFTYRNSLTPETNWQSFNTFQEVTLASFIKDNMPSNSIIISDYFTMWVVTPLSNRIWVIDKFMGSVESPYLNERLRDIMHNVFLAPNSESAYQEILRISRMLPFDENDYILKTNQDGTPMTAIIVISRRTMGWIKQGSPEEFTLNLGNKIDPNMLRLFNNETYFVQQFQDGEDYYVYTLVNNTAIQG